MAGAQERASSPPSGATLHLLLPLPASSTSFFYLSARPTHMCMCTLVFSVRSEPAENARYCYIIIIVIVRGDSRRVPTVCPRGPCAFVSTVCCRLRDSPRRQGGRRGKDLVVIVVVVVAACGNSSGAPRTEEAEGGPR